MENNNDKTSDYESPVKFMLTLAQCVQNGMDGLDPQIALWARFIGADPSWPSRIPILISGSYPGKRPRWFMKGGEIRQVNHSEYRRLIDEHTTIPDNPSDWPVLRACLFDFKIKANNKFEMDLYRGPRSSRRIKGHYHVEDGILSLNPESYAMS